MDSQLFDPDFFFAASQQDLLLSLKRVFGTELERLKRAYSIRDSSSTVIASPSPSQILYSADYDEVNRTLVGVLALRWIRNNEYDTFVASQPASVRLTRDSFTWLRDCIARAPDIPLLITAVMINDLGKDPHLVSDLNNLTGGDTATANHDILLRAVHRDMVPAISRLSPSQRINLIHGLELGAVFNYGQLAQAENAPASLVVLNKFQDQICMFR